MYIYIYFIYSVLCKPYMWSCLLCLPSCPPGDCFRRGCLSAKGLIPCVLHQLESMVNVITPKLMLTNGPGSTLVVPL